MTKALAIGFWCVVAWAQAPQRYTFEVASVKALGSARPGSGSTGITPPIGSDLNINWVDVSLLGLICRAYDVKPLQVTAADWMRTDRYSVAAKPPADAPKGHIPEMLRSLLEDRFALKIRWETKEEQGYALVVGKGGPKLTKSEAAEKRSTGMQSSGVLTWRASTLDDVATSLTLFMGAPVADMTGLGGVYDIKIQAAPDSMPGFRFGNGADSNFPSIFDAVKALGLNLERRKVETKYLVVVSANKIPTEN